MAVDSRQSAHAARRTGDKIMRHKAFDAVRLLIAAASLAMAGAAPAQVVL